MTDWLDGAPTEPGLYWYQLQGSAMVRYCEIVRQPFDYHTKRGVIKKGDLVLAMRNVGSEPCRPSWPFRRWMPAGCPRPVADPDWQDPRYVAQLKEKENG